MSYKASQNGNVDVKVNTSGLGLPYGGPECYQKVPQQPAGQPATLAMPVDVLAALPPAPVAPTRDVSRTGTTLQDLVVRFRKECKHLATSTRTKLECHFTVAAKHLDFNLDVGTISLAQLRELKGELCKDRKPASVNDILFKGLGPLFKMAVEDELIDRSPLERLARVKQREPERKDLPRKLALEIEQEVGRFAPESAIIIGFMRLFGVGQAEIKHLLVEHVDLDKKVVHFRRKKTGKSFDVPIHTEALAFVERLRSAGRLAAGKPVVAYRNPRKALESACDRLKCLRFEPRAFRRSFIVWALECGVEPRVVAQWQGHNDATMILRVYGKQIHAEHDKIQAEKLAGG